MTWYVYTLADPRTGTIRYVGKSVNPARRMHSHFAPSASASVRRWVESLHGAEPVLAIEAQFEHETDALLAEKLRIQELRVANVPLLNRRRGGEQTPPRNHPKFRGIHERVLLRRKQLGLRQNALAAASGLAQGLLSRLESGNRVQITAESAVLIAGALGCTVEWLVTGQGPATPDTAEGAA